MKTAAIAIVGLVALICFQEFVLAVQPEKLEEDRSSNLGDLPASSLLPSYIASQFLGSFRAVAIDAMWIRFQTAREEKRYFLVKEILEILRYLQPRNEEVHAMLGWEQISNISAIVSEKNRWRWEKSGFETLYKANQSIPESPYLKREIAEKLWWHARPISGQLYTRFIKEFESDLEIQRMLQEDPQATPKSPFEIAVYWMDRSTASIVGREYFMERAIAPVARSEYITQMGLHIAPMYNNSFVRDFLICEAMLRRSRGDYQGAKEWLLKAMRHVENRLEKDLMNKSYLRLLPQWAEALDYEKTDPRESLRRYTALLKEFGNLDDRWMDNAAGEIKRKLGGDALEFDDREEDVHVLVPGQTYTANIWPKDDIDFYALSADPKVDENDRPLPFKPIIATITLQRKGLPGVKLQAFIGDYANGRLIAAKPLGEPIDLPDKPMQAQLKLSQPGVYFIKVFGRYESDERNSEYTIRLDKLESVP